MSCSIILLNNNQWNAKSFHYIFFSCERQDLLCSHSNGDIFTCEGNMLFSCVKISCLWYSIGDKFLYFRKYWCSFQGGFLVWALFNHSGNSKLHLRTPSPWEFPLTISPMGGYRYFLELHIFSWLASRSIGKRDLWWPPVHFLSHMYWHFLNNHQRFSHMRHNL